jgi:hypothetical protein
MTHYTPTLTSYTRDALKAVAHIGFLVNIFSEVMKITYKKWWLFYNLFFHKLSVHFYGLVGTMPWSAGVAKFLMRELRCHHLKLHTTDCILLGSKQVEIRRS